MNEEETGRAWRHRRRRGFQPMGEGIMTLDGGSIGQSYEVVRLTLPQRIEKRLEALGMTEGTQIDVLNSKDHGTMIIKVRGTRLAVGRGISANIYVRS